MKSSKRILSMILALMMILPLISISAFAEESNVIWAGENFDAGNPAGSGVDMLDDAWRNEYSTDSYHLKDTGMAVMADHMLPLLWEIVMNAK